MTQAPDLGRRLITGGIEVVGDPAPGEGRQRVESLIEDPTDAKYNIIGFGFDANFSGVNFIIDGGGSAITTGIKGDILIPFVTRIFSARLLADQSGSIKIDIWKDVYLNFPPTNADTITGGQEPEISSATKWSSGESNAIMVAWDRELKQGDILRINVDSITTITRVTLVLIFINDIIFTPIQERVTS